MPIERTFLMIKPDGVQRGLVGEIITRFEKKGWKLVAAKFVCASPELLEEIKNDFVTPSRNACGGVSSCSCMFSQFRKDESELVVFPPSSAPPLQPDILSQHYAEHKGKPFLPNLINFMSSGPVMAMVWEGMDIIAQARKVMGATNPNNADVGTIRADYCVVMGRNVIHGSDGQESAAREISLWFHANEIIPWQPCTDAWKYE
eukprot:Blabericola_migrator_1__159@NODE_1041_length_5625_cov_143_923893_g717_i0_p3_GENE_NODE_1041_length_5625_cov_143_923893_g717_i0NODE_1041_length_5625_cov_143_923893_g717_i0_p3_ORF_typecomplete_len203_score40_23NDK/PF00334_19/4_6e13NDK/PF00334_19/1e35_NODE_1041_length_5625_cov_143_923893_g717_i047935401